MSNIKLSFKRNFFTGLITILPLWITLFIVWFVFRWISSFAAPFLSPVFYLVFGREGGFLVRLTSFVLTIITIWFVGVLATQLLGRRLLLWIENIVIRLPIMSGIYLAIRKLIQSLFTTKQNFKRVVMVEFPKNDSYSIGFVTGTCELESKGNFISVFVPTTPNPTTGFLLFVRQENMIPMDMSVDEAVRLIISGGIIAPGKTLGCQ